MAEEAGETQPAGRVLVLRLGALGDFVLSFGPFAAIRAHHPDARVTLLTTPPFTALADGAPWFDTVVTDRRPAWWDLPGVAQLAGRLRGFDMVYDLQTSDRSARYFRLAGQVAWSGHVAGCSAPHANPGRDSMHTLERQREQLQMAGITSFPAPDLSWLTGRATPDLPDRFALLVPGAAAHRPDKRWPVAHFAALVGVLRGRGLASVVVGSVQEQPLARAIPDAVDLTGRTSLADLFAVAARASLAIGNDTGPMHIAASVGCPSITLFSAASDPALTAPRYPDGGWPTVLRAADLADLAVERVAAALP